MKNVFIRLQSIEQVQHFVNTLAPLEGDFELITKKHILDARSMMGIFSLDLSVPIKLKVYNDNEQNMNAIQPFMAFGEIK